MEIDVYIAEMPREQGVVTSNDGFIRMVKSDNQEVSMSPIKADGQYFSSTEEPEENDMVLIETCEQTILNVETTYTNGTPTNYKLELKS